ncbi:RIP metalloprotease [Phenylobacterium sp.]|uniref:M50 family metallopeptidase n=1 Tax=Phenylobacterium sp. TaxID=1871053 RepID=UPI002CA429F9|nr:RIP metalloprotease [Phenylobacterium sp.]HVI30532.1 RIP metalloprotease [Phenylobacterium sp.]
MIGFLQTALMYVVPFLIVLGVVVTVHELGHFLAAKWLGTKIDQFAIGFGRPLASWRDKSGVQWRIGWLPLGGYVRFAGDDNAASVPDTDDLDAMRRDLVAREGEAALNRYFHFKPLWQRAVITAAGPIANFLLAIAIFAGLLMALGEPIQSARVARVEPGAPAERAGLRPGDVLLAGEGKTIRTPADVKQLIILRSGLATDFTVDRGGRVIHLQVTPERGDVADGLGRTQKLGRIGVAFDNSAVTFERYGPLEAVAGGVERTRDVVVTTVFYIGRMISGRETADQLSGPLGMAQISGDLTKQNVKFSPDASALVRNALLTLLVLVANISVGIGFLNLLPIPVLDGGHLLFYGYEAIARRPLAAKVQAAGYRVGLALVLGLMLFATWNDLQRLRVFNLFGGLFS